MSEYQNKTVTLMRAWLGEKSVSDPQERNEAFLAASIDLFHALGGSTDMLLEAAKAAGDRPAPAVDAAIGNVMKELAVIGSLQDLDIMQAAYNTLDEQTQSIPALPAESRKAR